MSRESNDGFVCSVCLETIYRGECACEPPVEQERQPTFREGQAQLAQALAALLIAAEEQLHERS